jgi:hypothetical protein
MTGITGKWRNHAGKIKSKLMVESSDEPVVIDWRLI